MIIKARTARITFDINEEADETEPRFNDFDHIDDTLNIYSIITIFQYLKDKYTNNGEIHMTINRGLDGPATSWLNYQ
jgi:hypothetical protein